MFCGKIITLRRIGFLEMSYRLSSLDISECYLGLHCVSVLSFLELLNECGLYSTVSSLTLRNLIVAAIHNTETNLIGLICNVMFLFE